MGRKCYQCVCLSIRVREGVALVNSIGQVNCAVQGERGVRNPWSCHRSSPKSCPWSCPRGGSPVTGPVPSPVLGTLRQHREGGIHEQDRLQAMPQGVCLLQSQRGASLYMFFGLVNSFL